MKNLKKKILALVAMCTFAGLMMLNVSTTINDSNFNVTSLTSLAYGTTSGGNTLTCYTTAEQCGWSGSCYDYVRCTNCSDAEGRNLLDQSTCSN